MVIKVGTLVRGLRNMLYTVVEIIHPTMDHRDIYMCIKGGMKYRLSFFIDEIEEVEDDNPKFKIGSIVRRSNRVRYETELKPLVIVETSNRLGSLVRQFHGYGYHERIYIPNRNLKRIK